MFEIVVCEVREKCPVYKMGDKMVADDPRLVLRETDAVSTHALSSLLHYVLALQEGADPVKLGLSKPEDWKNAFIQCVDPWKPILMVEPSFSDA